MSDRASIPPLEISFEVAASVAKAFDLWVSRPLLWWPKGHTMSGSPVDIVIEARVGGRMYERAEDGRELDWGEVLEWDAPQRIRFLWHLFFTRAEATQVELVFTPTATGTHIVLRQTGWDDLGEVGPIRRERTVQGWATVTEPYRSLLSMAD